jgi:hypothetical protein
MDWTMLGALGEILGAVGVVISLVYLGASVRGSSGQARHQAARSVLQQLNRVAEVLGAEPQAVYVWRRGHKGVTELTDDELIQSSSLLLLMMRPYEELFYYRRDGVVDEWAWAAAIGPVHQLMSTPGFVEWWRVRSSWPSPDFQGHIAGVIKAPPANDDLSEQYRRALGDFG